MLYTTRNFGDKARLTRHLSMLEHGALILMEDWSAVTEEPLPEDEKTLFRKFNATSKAEQQAIRVVRDEFWQKTDHGWLNPVIEQDIKNKLEKSGKASSAAKQRWDKQRIAAAMHSHPPSDANAMRPHSGSTANGMLISNHKSVISNHQSSSIPPHNGGMTATTEPGEVAPEPDPVDVNLPVPPQADPSPEKKEGAAADAEVWLPVESPEAARALNRALGRDERRALTPEEGAGFARYAAQWGGEVSTARLARLGRYLLAHPRYDSRAEAERAKVPEGSLLRRRKQFLPRLFEDLPNQAEFAEQWAAEGEKKERAAARHPLEIEPAWDWEAVACRIAPLHGWDAAVIPLCDWTDLSADHRQIICAAKEGEAV